MPLPGLQIPSEAITNPIMPTTSHTEFQLKNNKRGIWGPSLTVGPMAVWQEWIHEFLAQSRMPMLI